MSNEVALISEGFLGSCWYGNYHYLEPWIGCNNDCIYCYARARGTVKNSLERFQDKAFAHPRPLYSDHEELCTKIKSEISKHTAKTLKLCRYTDFFTPSMQQENLPAKILQTICEETSVQRIIITTKCCPDQNSIEIMKRFPEHFSMNLALLPREDHLLMPSLKMDEALEQKMLTTAKMIQDLGVKTTIHLDPISFSVISKSAQWESFLAKIRSAGLSRVMFSYLVLDPNIMEEISKTISKDYSEELFSLFDFTKAFDYDYTDESLWYMKQEIRQQHLEMISSLLTKLEFDFTLCSLKSAKGGVDAKKAACRVCNGDFYA
ncbi:MAG: hypothetical protein HQK50_16535 [Oligoflexia bacterium]|nr:hypothetical protein [Oligoflexia bacterium]MBF0367185.1 hypothetical protein [Oligoflexia bacterium]